jgi:hypothetical protein
MEFPPEVFNIIKEYTFGIPFEQQNKFKNWVIYKGYMNSKNIMLTYTHKVYNHQQLVFISYFVNRRQIYSKEWYLNGQPNSHFQRHNDKTATMKVWSPDGQLKYNEIIILN